MQNQTLETSSVSAHTTGNGLYELDHNNEVFFVYTHEGKKHRSNLETMLDTMAIPAEKREAYKANIYHRVLQDEIASARPRNGFYGASIYELVTDSGEIRAFVASNHEQVNSREEYMDRGCSETRAKDQAIGALNHRQHHTMRELHLLGRLENQEKIVQTLCGVCRDVTHDASDQDSLVYLHPIDEIKGNEMLPLEVITDVDSKKSGVISRTTPYALLPLFSIPYANTQKATRVVKDGWNSLIDASNTRHQALNDDELNRIANQKMLVTSRLDMQQTIMLAMKKFKQDKTSTTSHNISDLTHNGKSMLSAINALMVEHAKQQADFHLLQSAMKSKTPEKPLASLAEKMGALPDKITIVAAIDNNGMLAITSLSEGEMLASKPNAGAIAGANMFNTRGLQEIFVMEFDKTKAAATNVHPGQPESAAKEPLALSGLSGNSLERLGKNASKDSWLKTIMTDVTSRELTDQRIKMKATFLPPNDGKLAENDLKELMYETSIGKLLPGRFEGPKAIANHSLH